MELELWQFLVCNLWPVTCPLSLSPLQLRVLLHQLFQSESWKLYRNLGVFSFALALVDSALTVFRMPDTLSWTKRPATATFLDRHLRSRKLLAARGKKLR